MLDARYLIEQIQVFTLNAVLLKYYLLILQFDIQ